VPRKTNDEPKESSVTFPGQAGDTTIPLYEDMLKDLPPLWQLRYEDLLASFLRGDVGDQEFAMRLAAIFTHLPAVPGNQRVDTRVLDRGVGTTEMLVGLVRAGLAIMPFITPKQAVAEVEAPNA
jgi:hypothetical protein